jgi:chorismate mutase/prephenate dehydrogenase
MNAINELRAQIDIVDSEIVSMICRRQTLIKALGLLKKHYKVPLRNESIEKRKLAVSRKKASDLCVDPVLVSDVMRLLIAHSILEQTREV